VTVIFSLSMLCFPPSGLGPTVTYPVQYKVLVRTSTGSTGTVLLRRTGISALVPVLLMVLVLVLLLPTTGSR
jgi:hypothetical protein